MKYSFICLLSLFLFFGCQSEKSKSQKQVVLTFFNIPNDSIVKAKLVLHANEGKWYFNNKPFSGFAIRHFNTKKLAECIGFYKGRKEGEAKQWYANAQLKKQCFYKQNTLVNTYKTYWPNGLLAYEVNYTINGKKEGIEKFYWRSGSISKARTLRAGQEHGLQQAWLKNGKLYVNYEAKNGRIFGMRRANSCYA
ncbi:toxin-antitoxin system YwqK family antitoxin [Flavicella sediminum]|uniref:toxin-antitoxin system YwqK family antitoxin n=1 Tax=Flavicella sediminum TaxID=2585141 RepID=UPI00111CA609|nr:hypothetical protein [Flavicella sediminum]